MSKSPVRLAAAAALLIAPLALAEIRYVDAVTGGRVTSRDGYAPAQIDVPATDADVEIHLTPLKRPAEVSVEQVRRKHRAGAMLIAGFVTDGESGAALPATRVSASGVEAITDGRGYFEMHVPSEPKSTSVTFEREGYGTIERRGVDLWSNGDWIFAMRMTRGAKPAVLTHGIEPAAHDAAEDGDATPSTREAGELNVAGSSSSRVPLPTHVRVHTSDGVIHYVPLQDYTQRVLSSEWIASWAVLGGGAGIHSLRAGAVAIKTYAIGYVRNPMDAAYDICGTPSCQKYDPTRWNSDAQRAVDDTNGQILVDGSGDVTFKMTEYARENNGLAPLGRYTGSCGDGFGGDSQTNCLPDPVCSGAPRCITLSDGSLLCGHGRGMCQYGSIRWAVGFDPATGLRHNQGTKDWKAILRHYYPSLTLMQGATLSVGTNVRVRGSGTAGLKVRACAGGGIEQGINCPTVATKMDGAQGRVVGGPQVVLSDGRYHVWWKIQWSDGATGWSAENWLDVVPTAPSMLVWRHAGSGQVAVWLMNGATVISSGIAATVADPAWRIGGRGDLDGDGRIEIVWHHPTGSVASWTMSGTTIASSAYLPSNTAWLAGIGDVNADGRDDLVWHHADGRVLANGVELSRRTDTRWKVAAIADVDGDRDADVIWRHSGDGRVAYGEVALPNPDLSWTLAGTSDLNADGRADLVWRHSGGANVVWLMNGASVDARYTTTAASSWTLGTINGTNLVWRNTSTGENAVWTMGGAAVASAAYTLPVADLNWRIAR